MLGVHGIQCVWLCGGGAEFEGVYGCACTFFDIPDAMADSFAREYMDETSVY